MARDFQKPIQQNHDYGVRSYLLIWPGWPINQVNWDSIKPLIWSYSLSYCLNTFNLSRSSVHTYNASIPSIFSLNSLWMRKLPLFSSHYGWCHIKCPQHGLFVKSHKIGFELVCCVSNQNIITKCEDILLIKTLVHTKAQSTFWHL